MLLWPAFTDPGLRSWRKPILIAAGVGFVLGAVFCPPLGTTLTMQGGGAPVQRYMGILNTAVLQVAPAGLAQSVEDELRQTRDRLEEGRASHLDLVAPKHFGEAERDLADAEEPRLALVPLDLK